MSDTHLTQLKKSVCFNSQTEMRQICSTIAQDFDIQHFGYIKCYRDGTHLNLNTHCDWLEHVYRECFQKYDVFYKTIDTYDSGILLWSTIPDQSSFEGFKEHSQIGHGIVIIEKRPDICEFYNFASHIERPDLVNFYLNHLDLLWQHIYYFKDKAHRLIQKADHDRFILPKCTQATPQDKLIQNFKYPQNSTPQPHIKRYYLRIDRHETYLTHPEVLCCHYLAKGQAIKEIAKRVKLSARTVEHHLEKAKERLNCTSKAELIQIIWTFTQLHQLTF